jgi:hypothetical protein
MSLENATTMRLCSAVAIVLVPLLGAVAHAADKSLTGTVTDAFETVVIDAANAASKATAAAKDALAPETRKSKKSKKSEKDGAKPDPGTPEATGNPEAKSGKDTASEKPDRADKETPAEPAAKAAGDAGAADPKSEKADAAAKKPPPIPTEWPAVEVELARARCTQLLKGVDAVTIPEAPFRKGDCGTMAPVRLVSIGKNPEVTFSPPPVVTCDLVIGLTKWIKDEVQPTARRHLGSEVIRIESMSDYSCRMAYGRIGNKLSEHGKANALDIRGFITRKGSQAVVLNDWGLNKRDVLKQLVAERAAAEKLAAAKAEADRARAAGTEPADGATVTKLPRKTIAEGLSKDAKKPLAVPASITKDGALDAKGAEAGDPADIKKAGKTKKEAAREKGKRRSREETALLAALPPEEAAKVKAPPPKTPTGRFLHEVHAAGCRIFGTTLGPEANEAHRNHFHVDMAERKYKKICD